MDQDKLHALLADLDRELKATRTLDAESQRLLERVLADIPAGSAGAAPEESAESRLRELVARIEAEHPRLSGIVGQVADALGRLGI